MRAAYCGCYVLNDSPILPCISWGIYRLVDLDHLPFNLRDHSFIFFLKRARQHDVRMACRIVEKEIDRHIKIKFIEHPLNEIIVWQRHQRIEADRNQPTNLTALNLAEHLITIHTWLWQIVGGDVPHLGHMSTMLGVGQISHQEADRTSAHVRGPPGHWPDQ